MILLLDIFIMYFLLVLFILFLVLFIIIEYSFLLTFPLMTFQVAFIFLFSLLVRILFSFLCILLVFLVFLAEFLIILFSFLGFIDRILLVQLVLVYLFSSFRYLWCVLIEGRSKSLRSTPKLTSQFIRSTPFHSVPLRSTPFHYA